MGYLVVIFDEGTPDLATTTTTCQRVISRYGSYFSFFQQFHISGVLLGLSTTASHHFLVHLTWVVGCFFLLLRRYDDHISSLEESPGVLRIPYRYIYMSGRENRSSKRGGSGGGGHRRKVSFLLLSDGRLGIICLEFLEFAQVLDLSTTHWVSVTCGGGEDLGWTHTTDAQHQTYCIIELVALHNLYYRTDKGTCKKSWVEC